MSQLLVPQSRGSRVEGVGNVSLCNVPVERVTGVESLPLNKRGKRRRELVTKSFFDYLSTKHFKTRSREESMRSQLLCHK